MIDTRIPIAHASYVTADGQQLIFMSNRSQTGYDNTDAVSGEALSEVYRYDATGDRLACVSCRPSGARPEGRELGDLYQLPQGAESTRLRSRSLAADLGMGGAGEARALR